MAHTVALGDRRQRLTSRSAFDGFLEQRTSSLRVDRRISACSAVIYAMSSMVSHSPAPKNTPGLQMFRGWFSGRSGPAKSLGAGFSRKMADQNVGWRTDFNSLRREVTQAHHE